VDDKTVHDLLDGALAGEPPIGPVAQNALTAGLRLRRRRRIRAAAATAAAAVIALAIPAGLGAFGHLLKPARPQQPPAPPTLYIYGADLHVRHHRGQVQDTVTPVGMATNTPGKPIHTGTPNMPGTDHIVITPDGKTAYVMTGSGVTPISTATNKAGTTIHVGQGNLAQIAITPDGKTVYVSTVFGCHDRPSNEYCTFAVTPISTATNTPRTPITVGSGPWTLYDVGQIAITPDGKTAYVTTGTSVTPISTATNTPGKPIHLGKVNIPGGGGPGGQIVITPDGKTAYVTTGSGVTPISTATNTPGKPIHVVGTIAIAITP